LASRSLHEGLADTVPTFQQVVRDRFSCRAFRPDAVPRETINNLLEISQRAPSWCNVQPWEVVVTSGDATARLREALHAAALGQEMTSDIPVPVDYHGIYGERRRAAGYGLYQSLGIERNDVEGRRNQGLKNFTLFGAPHAAVITCDAALGPYALVDCGAFVSTFLMAAHSLGIATVAQGAIAMHSAVVHEELDIGEDRLVVCGIAFGFPDLHDPANGFRTERAQQSHVVRWLD
jgi:nitroreductase